MATFSWPWQYNFPPFFTIQPNLDTRKKQLEAWCSLVLNYQKSQKNYILDTTEAQNSPLFYNKDINRRLSTDGIQTVLEELRKRGNVEWKDKAGKQCIIMWRTPEEWGNLVYKYITDRSMKNTVCTLYELTHEEDTENQEFHGLEDWLLLRALQCLQSQGKAELMGDEGVKFF
ncbi:hypothetical protein CHS0354_026176 [Potamilus streckersoni]|uniref:Vacuolar protein-sorting-associated protein 25 n=1 Tax=Potamilus streckersoni TaxID=2493646 RepID=A0AAE0VSN8_9BIVA|nr:hypothetical protein CHS0354_026176 [Potamilus streckersoni]